MTDELERIRDLDRRLGKAVRSIRILSTLSWPESAKAAFVDRWRRGELRLPSVSLPRIDLDQAREQLGALLPDLGDHPLERLLKRNAESWSQAVDLLAAAGTREFTARSIAIYGHPRDRLHEGGPTHLEVALRVLADNAGLAVARVPEPELEAPRAAEWLQAEIGRVLADLQVVVDPNLAARAIAGQQRIRLRGTARFPQSELEQLLQHEILVHSLTARNGREQAVLKSLAAASPRTTCTQEGLATFAELAAGVSSVQRLRLVALRVVAIDAALQGADFLDVFKMFREAGEDDAEACQSASRVFRGGDVKGAVAFTKDVVYLKGALHTQAYLLAALQRGRPDLLGALFLGRVTWDDACVLAEWVGKGVDPPAALPAWVTSRGRLATLLAWTTLHRAMDLGPRTLGALD